jgi:hypothetical protein
MSVLSTGNGIVRMLLVILQLIEVIQPGVDGDVRRVQPYFGYKQHTARAVGKPHYFILKLSKYNLIIAGDCKICQIEQAFFILGFR